MTTKTILGLSIVALIVTLAACKKEAGPTGPAGTNGKDGNANVVLYKFAGNDFSTISDVTRRITMSQDSFDRYAWFGYLKYDNKLTYSLPGYGYGGLTSYRFYTNNESATSHTFEIGKVSGTGESYDSIKIIGVNISKVFGKR